MNGSCVEGCPAPLAFCDPGVCVDLSVDLRNCGVCGFKCRLFENCVRGECVLACPEDLAFCPPGVCVDLQTDNFNCGECNFTCTAQQTCSAGLCTFGCFPPLVAARNPARASTSHDPLNCGPAATAARDEICQGALCLAARRTDSLRNRVRRSELDRKTAAPAACSA